MAAHTPGPWQQVSDGEANFYGFIAGGHWLFRVQQNGELSISEQSANVNLIAAAPDLLEALEACAESLALARDKLGMFGEGDDRDRKADTFDATGSFSALNLAIAAINKAKGS